MPRLCESGDDLTGDADLVGEQEHAKLGAGADRWAARGPPTGSTCSSLCLSITSIEVNSWLY